MAWSARRADRVLAICPTTSADLIRHYGTPPDKISVAWPGLDASFRPAPESEPSTNDAARRLLGDDLPYVLFVGKFSPRRNVPALLEAFAGVAESRPDLRLVFVGPRSSDVQVERLAAEYGIDDRVLHVVDPQRGDLRTLFAQARAFAMPTEAEGFSLTILEAMASGCPVLTLKGAALGVLEYLDGPPGHESGGPVLEAEDASPDGLARALERLVDDDRLRAELAERGIQAAATFPSWDDTARKIIECLAEVAGLDRPAVPRRVGTPG